MIFEQSIYNYFLLFIGLSWFVSCYNPPVEATVFHYNQHNSITSLDPAFAKSQNNIWATHHIFSTLVQLDQDLAIQPAVAKSWTIDEEALNYTFNLRQDVLFHTNECLRVDNRAVVAEDIAYSLLRLRDTTLNAPGSWILENRLAEPPFTVHDDSTLTIHLSAPFAPFLSLLTMQYCSIVPRECVEFYGSSFNQNPVGSGPFKFKRWDENQGLFLLRNEEYYEWKDSTAYSNIDGVRTSFIGERSIAFLELINERIDYFSGLESGYINTALTQEGILRSKYSSVMFDKAPYLNFEYLGINPNAPEAHPLLQNVAFRRALNYAIDRELMLRSLRNGVGQPADAGVITKGLPAYDPNIVRGYRYDRQKAIEIIKSLSQELLDIPLMIYTSKDYLDLTTYIAKQWEYIGITTEIEVMESAALRDAMRKGNIPLFRASWIADYPDGESFLSMFYGNNPAPPNYTHFRDAEYDRMYQQCLSVSDIDQKVRLYQQMDQLLIDRAPVIFLFYDETAQFINIDIDGIESNALNLLSLKNVVKR